MLIVMILLIAMFSDVNAVAPSLDEIGKKCGTDKSSMIHNYTRVYEKYFESKRYQALKILEIGFYRGNSARMWHEYFPNAQLYFIDIDSYCYQCMHGLSARAHLYMKDQANERQLRSFLQEVGGDFDIIIDDGGHTMRQQQISFIQLFPALKKGGMYIIEDLHTSYDAPKNAGFTREEFKQFRNEEKITTVDFLRRLVHDVNFISSQSGIANTAACSQALKEKATYWQSSIASIHFYPSLAFILKEE